MSASAIQAFRDYAWMLLPGFAMTIAVGLASMALAIVLGLVGATGKLARSSIARASATTYTTVIRGEPELILLYLVFYGGGSVLQNIAGIFGYTGYIEVNPFVAGVFTIGFAYGAYATEVFRGAILAVPKGQLEAAKACGMNRWLVLRRILMPQVWRFAIPGLGNVWLVLIKATAVTSAIGIEELTRKAHLASGATHQAFLFFLLTALLYLLLTAVSNVVFHRAEKHANRGVRRA